MRRVTYAQQWQVSGSYALVLIAHTRARCSGVNRGGSLDILGWFGRKNCGQCDVVIRPATACDRWRSTSRSALDRGTIHTYATARSRSTSPSAGTLGLSRAGELQCTVRLSHRIRSPALQPTMIGRVSASSSSSHPPVKRTRWPRARDAWRSVMAVNRW
jgi:hypothetical protein